jgi:putative ABC transport system ATP-binding protein
MSGSDTTGPQAKQVPGALAPRMRLLATLWRRPAKPVPSPRDAAPPRAPAKKAALDRLFVYIWKNSRRQQLIILAVVLVSMPFYFVSLDLPKTIVNGAIQGHAFPKGQDHALLLRWTIGIPDFLGGGSITLFPGMDLSRVGYLFWLSGLFLFLVLVNGGFKYVVNMEKGKLGERVLQKLRLDLFTLLLRFSPEAIRNVKASEAATIIKDEVEPIGAFVGDAFIAPVFLGGQALTALLFILLQSPALGIAAGGMVMIQGVVIPRMRREQLRLGRQRQLQSRSLAGRIGEIVEGMAEVDNHGTSHYERHQIATLLDRLFWIRYQLYGRKFMVKFINNILAQITPFMFYSIGGYFALKGSLDIGQLVAVIAAYRDLPPPVKELIDWDQQRLDVEVKYQQVLEQFTVAGLAATEPVTVPSIKTGEIETQGLRVVSSGGEVLLDGVSTSIPLGSHTALLALAGDGASTLAQVIGRRIAAYSGTVRIAGHDLAALPGAAIGPKMAYAGPEATVFQGTIRDNVVYSLKRQRTDRPAQRLVPAVAIGSRPGGRQQPSRLAVEPTEWIDYAAAGAAGPEDIDERIVEALRVVGMDEAVYRFGLGRTIDPQAYAELTQRIVEARQALRAALEEQNVASLIESFHPERFNRNATIGENLAFGVARGDALDAKSLTDNAFMRAILESSGLMPALVAMGIKIADIMVEIFAGVSADHFLFEQFSFISVNDVPLYEEILARTRGRGEEGPAAADARHLVALALMYVEPRHRLGLLTPELEERIVAARKQFMAGGPELLGDTVEFYDPDRYCAAAPLRDNLLFGRIAYGMPGASERVIAAVRRVLEERGLDREVYRLGLDQPTGPGGRLLFPSQRSAIGLARCLVKRPDVLILNQAMSAFGDVEGRAIFQRIKQLMEGRTLIVLTRDSDASSLFDLVIALQESRIKSGQVAAAGEAPTAPADGDGGKLDGEMKSLRAVPMFADMDAARLKLIAFASDRVVFPEGQTLFEQDAASDAAYIVLDGGADALLETPSGRIFLSHIGANSIVGEMGVINGAPRSATVIATADTTALRLSRDVLLGLLNEFPQISMALMRDMMRRLVAANALIARASDGKEAALVGAIDADAES